MPRDYGKITHRFWTGDTGKRMRSMNLEVRAVATYLMSCASANMIGLYYIPVMLIAHEVGSGLTIEGASKALRSLAELGFAYYDEAAEVVFVPHMAREQIADHLKPGDKQREGVISLLKEFEKSRFYNDFLDVYRDCYNLQSLQPTQAPSKALASPFEAPSKPVEQDQESREQRTGEQAAPKPLGPIRPRTAHDLIHCLRVAVEREQPQNGMWNPGGSFHARDARVFLEGFADLEAALETIEQRIELFARDPGMAPWTVEKFSKQYNAIGQPKRGDGRRGAPAPVNYPKFGA